MEQFKGTQGKWEVDFDCGIINESSTGKSIALVNINARTSDKWKANAQLIALAPELLNVLRRIVECPNPNTDNEAFIFVEEVKGMAEEAINKALGKEAQS